MITRDGIWIGPDWLRVSRDRDAHEGVIEREQSLRRQRAELEALQASSRVLDEELEAVRERVRATEDQLADEQAQLSRAGSAHMNLRSQLDSLRARSEQRSARMQQLTLELAELEGALETANAGNRSARARLEEAVGRMGELEDQRRALEAERDSLRQALADARQQAEQARNGAREVAIRAESRRTGHASLLASLERLDGQIAQFEARRTDLDAQLATSEESEGRLKETLELALRQRVVVEDELGNARRALEQVDAGLREIDEKRVAAEAAVQDARDLLENVKFSVQELRLRRETLLEQFAATRLELAEVVAALAPEADVTAWEQRLAETAEKIERLGQVNLAAIDEFKEQSERKEYLDRQFTDLTDALATLEDAIRRIDRETRSRFQDTFDRVNAGLKEKFPRLFGGGTAYLELVGEDVLESGVAIMARPPGQAEQLDQHAVRRREGPHGRGARVLDLRAQPGTVLPARRGGRPARREQRRAILRDRARDVGARAVRVRHAQQDHDGARQPAARSHDERTRRVAAGRRGRGRGDAPRSGLRQGHERAALDPAGCRPGADRGGLRLGRARPPPRGGAGARAHDARRTGAGRGRGARAGA